VLNISPCADDLIIEIVIVNKAVRRTNQRAVRRINRFKTIICNPGVLAAYIESQVGWAGYFARRFHAVLVFGLAIAGLGIRSAWAQAACASMSLS
jgi:hypothetical protein